MSFRTRWMLVLAALLVIPVFFMPIWSITLTAPQYPQGIGMHIWLDQVTGHDQHDIQNINILNHYIGMQPIEQESFWEFDVMPYVFAAMIGLGLLVAAGGRRWMLWTWIGLFVLLTLGGLGDFYYWSHQFGHNLDPQAPLKVPGMAYHPPLLGSKQLLNIHATSWPYWGSLFAGLSLLTGIGALANEYRNTLRALFPSNRTNTTESAEVPS